MWQEIIFYKEIYEDLVIYGFLQKYKGSMVILQCIEIGDIGKLNRILNYWYGKQEIIKK